MTMPLTGDGYLAGEYPGGTTTVEGVPVSATVRILYRPESGQDGDGALVAQVQSAPDGTWRVEGLRTDLLYDVVGRKEGFNDVIVANVTPTSMVDITYSGAVVENETFTGAVGFLELVGGIPPYSVAPETPFPSGLFPIVDGRSLIIDGTTDADEVASFDVKVTSSNGAEKIIPLQLVVGFKAPANFKAETVVVDDVFSVSLTWEVTNSTQKIEVYRSATPFDLDDLPEPIATLSGTSTTYTDDDVIEDDHFYYMVTAVCEQYELRSNVIAEDVTESDPHWNSVVALMHFDGDLEDETGRIWTVRGGASSSSDQDKFGGGSLYVPTSARAGLHHSASPDFALSQTDYTIEMFVFPESSGAKWFLEFGSESWTTRFWIDRDDGKLRVAGGPAIAIWIHNGIIPDNEWTHIAVTIEGGVLRAFINGIIAGSASITGQIPTGDLSVGVGHTLPATASFSAQFIDELRITKGVARYTENFTPPTEPFPNK